MLAHGRPSTLINVTSRGASFPPAVATELAGPGQAHGADLDAFCDTVFPLLDGSRAEVGFGSTAAPDFTERRAAEQRTFEAMADRFDVPVYRPDGRVRV
ncbi:MULTISPECIES: hypothetical protein [unclassified Streptomyces]|uniref:hypothetical protein n=1 Tax=unclassified Streptomyces TaxID=2593676 RepID=UPI00380D1C90